MKATRTVLATVLVVLLVSFTAACQRNDDGRVQAAREDKMLAPQDTDIAMKIEGSHLGEIDLARWAKDHAQNGDVKDYAKMLEDQHSAALEDLQKMLNKHGVNESTHSKPAEAQDKMASLQSMSGAAFDREYINTMVDNHQKTLDALNAALSSTQNADLKEYINDLMPKVHKHLDEARELQTKLTKEGN
jgi:putative membrane protein